MTSKHHNTTLRQALSAGLLVFWANACLAEMPKMKPGMIETKASLNGHSMPAMRMCMTDKDMADSEKAASAQNKCSSPKFSQSGNTYTTEMSCTNPETGKAQQMKIEATPVSANVVRSKITSSENGKVVFQSEQTMTRIGDCAKEEADQANQLKSMTKDDAMKQFDMKDPATRKKMEDMMKQFKDMKQP